MATEASLISSTQKISTLITITTTILQQIPPKPHKESVVMLLPMIESPKSKYKINIINFHTMLTNLNNNHTKENLKEEQHSTIKFSTTPTKINNKK